MLPRVRRLHEKYGGALVAIGVHSGKFQRERRTGSIAAACRRLGVGHPVGNDRAFRVWKENSVLAWPTITIVDPEGYVVGQQSGELPFEGLDAFVGRIVNEHERRGTLNREPLSIAERPVEGDTGPLRFPTALAADIEGNLAVADSGNHRVLYGQTVGNSFAVRKVIGSGRPGFEDGPFGDAAFREPQGMALSGDMLIVADRGNHAIRMADLKSGQVATMAGTGDLAPGAISPGPAIGTPLRSPWDVLIHDYSLFVAMAGSHQIWRLSLRDGTLALHAGTGAEAIEDGSATEAALAQPMALASDEETWLYFADAESSSVRRVGFESGSEVETLVGTGLFDSGDVDGAGEEVRLQHAAGIAWGAGNHRLWIADTYNDKLKLLEPESRRVEELDPFDETLEEPMGLASAGHLLYVTDTNRHRILRVDQVDKRVVELGVELS